MNRLMVLLLAGLLWVACGGDTSTPPSQKATSGEQPREEPKRVKIDPLDTAQSNLTDTQRAALIAAARAIRKYEDPFDGVTPEHAVALRQVEASLEQAGYPGIFEWVKIQAGIANLQNALEGRPKDEAQARVDAYATALESGDLKEIVHVVPGVNERH